MTAKKAFKTVSGPIVYCGTLYYRTHDRMIGVYEKSVEFKRDNSNKIICIGKLMLFDGYDYVGVTGTQLTELIEDCDVLQWMLRESRQVYV